MADIGKAPDGFPKVMQAARALAGLTIDELAAKLHEEEHVSARTLRAIESGSRKTLAPAKRRAIIRACDQPAVMADPGFDLWSFRGVAELATADKLMKAEELAERWGLSVDSIYRLARDRQIPVVPLPGRAKRFRRDLIEKYEVGEWTPETSGPTHNS